MNILYIALKHVIWIFGICNYFREIFRFRDFMNISRNFAKSVFAHIFAKFKYFVKEPTPTESPDHVLYNDILNMFIFQKFKLFSDSHSGAMRCISRKLLIKSRNQNIFSMSIMSRNLW